MPIKPENKKLYSPNWKEISGRVRTRAGNKCEKCGVANYAVGFRDSDVSFSGVGGGIEMDLAAQGLQYPSLQPMTYKLARSIADGINEISIDSDDPKYIVIVLTVAHLNHDPTDNRMENLACYCQRCHLRHDQQHHGANARNTRNRKKKQLNLF